MSKKKLVLSEYIHNNIFLKKIKKYDEFLFINKKILYFAPDILLKKKFKIPQYPLQTINDEKKFYLSILKEYKFFLSYFSKFLNKYHNLNYSKKYWEVIIGVWLIENLIIIYEKYLIIKNIKNSSTFVFYKIKNNNLCFNNFREINLYTNSDYWNNYVTSNFIKNFKKKIKIKYIFLERKNFNSRNIYNVLSNLFKINSLKKMISQTFSKLTMKVKKKREIFILNSYLGIINEIKLQFKCNNLIKLNTDLNFISKRSFDYKSRIENNFFFKNKKRDIIKDLLLHIIPKTYLEDYKEIIKFSNNVYSKQTKIIYTAENFQYDDVFKIWSAEQKRTNGSLLIFCSHGGGFQTNLLCSHSYVYRQFCDKIFIWGKKVINNRKIIPLFNIKSSLKPYQIIKKKNVKFGNILIVQKFPTFYKNGTIADQNINTYKFENYIDFQIKFINSLDKKKKDKIIIRLGSNSVGNSLNNFEDLERKIWASKVDNIRLESRNTPIKNSIKRSYVVIITDIFSTTLPECITSGIPFLILVKLNNLFLNSRLKKIFFELKNKNILFGNPIKLAKFINSKSSVNFFKWWQSNKIQKSILKLEKNFSKNNRSPINYIANQLIKLSND